MIRRLLSIGLLAASVLGLTVGCGANVPNARVTVREGSGGLPAMPIAELGGLLFDGKFFPEVRIVRGPVDDAIVVPLCNLSVINKTSIPSRVDGEVLFIGREIRAGVKVPQSRELFSHPRLVDAAGKPQQFYRLYAGDRVEKDDIVTVLYDVTSAKQADVTEAIWKGAKAEHLASLKMITAAQALLDQQKTAALKKAVSDSEVIQAEASRDRYIAESLSKANNIDKTLGEFVLSAIRTTDHLVRSPFAGEIVEIFKSQKEGVKANAEPILQIQNFGLLQVEGFLDLQHEIQAKPDTTVRLEPLWLLPVRRTFAVHASGTAITSVAVSSHKDEPLVISAAEDHSVAVCDRNRNLLVTWEHRDTVRAVACTAPGAAVNLAIAGCADGIARIWDISNPKDLSIKPKVELVSKHVGGVQAVAFSPDGRFCITADERDIYLWETDSGKKVYDFPREHRGSISALHFLPECRAISVGRDSTANVWYVGKKGAAVERERTMPDETKIPLRGFEYRSGDISMPGVTEDGSMMLLDQDKSSLRLINLADHTPQATLRNTPGDPDKFNTFALFSPRIGTGGQRLILTGTSSEGVSRLWKMPTATERGSELARLVNPGGSSATCAAFSPHADNGGFIVIGTRRGEIHLWELPPESEIDHQWVAKISSLDKGIESSGRTRKIRAIFENNPSPLGRTLNPGTNTTMVITPAQP